MAALRMKGVVNPHAMPTTMKPKMSRIVEGEERSLLPAFSIKKIWSELKTKGPARKEQKGFVECRFFGSLA
jgi:hypothetical protein